MKRLILTIIFLFITSNVFAEVIGEVIEIREVTKGIVNIKVEYKDGDKLLEEISYTIADSPTAVAFFQDNILPKELVEVKIKEAKGEYLKKEKEPNLPILRDAIGKLKVGSKIGDKIK